MLWPFFDLRFYFLCFFAIFSGQETHFTGTGQIPELSCKLLFFFVSGSYSYKLRQLFEDIFQK